MKLRENEDFIRHIAAISAEARANRESKRQNQVGAPAVRINKKDIPRIFQQIQFDSKELEIQRYLHNKTTEEICEAISKLRKERLQREQDRKKGLAQSKRAQQSIPQFRVIKGGKSG